MFSNYLLTALRNITKDRLFSTINIVGLAVGLMAALLILLYVRYETSYDQEWSKGDRIYRFDTSFKRGSNPLGRYEQISGQFQAGILSTFPESIEAAVRFRYLDPTVRQGDAVSEEEVVWADASLTDIFDIKVLKGDLQAALTDKSSLAVSETFARDNFGQKDPIGQVLTLSIFNLNRDYRVVAVYQDLPRNSVVRLPAIALMDEEAFYDPYWLLRNWGSTSVQQYVLMKPGASIDRVEEGIPAMLDRLVESSRGKGSDAFGFHATRLSDFHLKWVSYEEMSTLTKMQLLMAIAIILVLVGAINFVNLATAQAIRRTREVALRKVLGAHRGQLIVQFLTESILVTTIAAMLAVVFLELTLPAFADFLDVPLSLSYGDASFWVALVSIITVVGGLAGFYPAFAISGSRPGQILMSNKSAESPAAIMLRQVLVTFQFVVSVVLIVATLVIYGQTWYVIHMDPGFDRENLLVVQGTDRAGIGDKNAVFRDRMLKLPMATAVTYSSETPSDGNNSSSSVGKSRVREEQSSMGEIEVDSRFFDAYGVPIVAGRNFSDGNEADFYKPSTNEDGSDDGVENRILMNETGARTLGFDNPAEAVGAQVYRGSRTFRIIGVVKDAKLQDANDPQRAEYYIFQPEKGYSLTVRYTGSPTAAVEAVRKVWQEMAPFTPFSFTFVDEAVANEFEQEVQMSKILTFFSGLAVVIACLGLYGLAAFSAERRTKEIGIRKVLGARVRDIVLMMLWQFSRPVIVANLIGWPIAFYAMSVWLEQYPNRIDSWMMLPACVAAGLAAFIIAWGTVAGRAYRVARSKPISALRYE